MVLFAPPVVSKDKVFEVSFHATFVIPLGSETVVVSNGTQVLVTGSIVALLTDKTSLKAILSVPTVKSVMTS